MTSKGGYFSIELLAALLNAGTRFVIRLEHGAEYQFAERHEIPEPSLPAEMRVIRTGWTVRL